MRRLLTFLALFVSATALGQPTANFTANVTQGCAPLLVQFTNTSTGTNSTTTYSWNFNNGTGGSVLPNPSTTFILPGTYTIVLTVTGPGGSNTKTVTNMITVHPAPTVAFSANDTDGCPPHAVQFTNTSNANAPGAVTYLWNFGDGTQVTTASPGHTYGLPGTYNTSLQITNSYGCSASLTKPGHITVYQPPVATFVATVPTACNAPGTTTFNPTVTGTGPFTYSWNFGDGSPTSTQSNPVKTYTTAGSFTVTLVVTDSRGCKDTAVMPAYINVGTLNASFTSNPTSVCEDAPVTFTNTSGPGATSAFWNFGNSQTGNGAAPTITYSTPGTYTVTLIVTQGTCQDTVQQTYVVQPKPIIDFTVSTQDPCPVPVTINFTNTTTGASTYTWLFGDGGTSNATSPSHTFTTYPNNYNPPQNLGVWDTVTLVATSSFGCTDTLRRPQYIRLRNLEAGIDATPSNSGCIPFTTTLTMSGLAWSQPPAPPPQLYPFPMTSWVWNFGDGSPTSTALSPTHTYTVAGTFYATLTYTTANGCTETDTIVIRTGTIPVPSFTVSPDTVCVNEPVDFTSTSTGVNNQTVYTWDYGDGGSGGGLFTQHNYTTSGTYTVVLTVDNNGCERKDSMVNVVTVNPPSAYFSTTWDCDTPTLVRFINTSQNPTSYVWYFGDNTTSTTDYNPVHIYPGLGSYNVKLVTFNSTFGCKDSFEVSVDLIDLPAQFSTADTTICAGQTAVFTGIYPPGTVNQLIWYTGIPNPPLVGNNGWYADTSLPVFTQPYPDTGRYTVRLAFEDSHGCWDTVTKQNHMLVARPSVGFNALPRLGCAPLPVTLLDTSHHVTGALGVTRAWTVTPTTSLSTTVNTASTTVTFPLAGLFNIKLKVTDNIGCADSLVKLSYVDVRHPSAAFFANDTSACIGQNISFISSSSGVGPLSFDWNFGDGGTGIGVAPVHAYSATGTYTVRLIVTDTVGCKDTLIRTAYISVTKPNASFTVSDTMAVCPPLSATVNSTSTGAVGYNWAFGNGGSSVNPGASNLYTASGIYTIRLIVSDLQGCTDTAEQNVRVLGYAGLLSYSPLTGCAPLTVSFIANIQNVPSIIWDFSDGVTQPATGQTTTHTYLTPGAYVPKLLLSDGTLCQASSLGLDTIKVDGVLPGFTTGTVCAGSPVVFTDTSRSYFSAITQAQWLFPSGPGASGPTTTRNFPTAGTYPVTLISTNAAGCKDTVVKSVTINPLPVVSAGPDTSICIGSTATLGASGAMSYVWSPAATLSNPAIANPAASPTSPTTYTVVGTDANGCKASDSMRILLQIKTTATAAAGDSACFGTPLQLQASGAETYQWVPTTGLDNPNIANPLATPAQTTTYLVISRESTCVPDSDRVTVVVWPKPEVAAGADVQIFSGKSTRLVASGPSINTFLWSPPDGLSCTDCPDPDAAPMRTTEYIVYASNNFGCSDTDAVIVTVLCDQSQLFIPNSFSPNGDGQNDRFFPHGAGLDRVVSFRVYNRWGETVYERSAFPPNSDADGWDGTQGGSVLPPDTFVYMVEAECLNGERIWLKGDVTLVR